MDDLEKELEAKFFAIDATLDEKLTDYNNTGHWHKHKIFSIPIYDLLGVRSPLAIRKLSLYPVYVNKFLSGYKPTTPLLCFVAGDKMIRVLHGNLLYWTAKETKQVSHLLCVFPKKDDAGELFAFHKDELNITNGDRYL